MKKLIAFLLVSCLILSLASVSLAAGGPKITKQPESATTDEDGTVSFSLKVTDQKGITWRFVNPATGEETTGKKLNSIFKKVKVSGPNSTTITLRNVPDEMHGWYVYCHLTGNGYEVDSDRVRLLVKGLPEPEDAEPVVPAPVAGTPAPAGGDETETETPAPQPSEAPQQPLTHIDENGDVVEGSPEAIKTVTIHAKDATLYPLDTYNQPVESGAAASLTFEGSGSVAVKANGEAVRYWLVNGIRFDSVESVTAFTLRDVTTDLSITAVLSGGSAQNVDESKMVTVTCEGCKFTWAKGGLKNVTSGKVPAGTEILIIANPTPVNGYSTNGGPFEDAGKMSVRRTVTEDAVIKAE